MGRLLVKSPQVLGSAVQPAGAAVRRWRKLRAWLRPPRRLWFERDGRIFTALALALGLAGVNTGNNLLYLLLGWALAVIVLSGVLSEHNLRGLRLERILPREAHAGRPARLGIRVENRKRFLPSFSLELEEVCGSPCTAAKVGVAAPRDSVVAPYELRPSRRGRLTLREIRVATRFPFGLFRKSRTVAVPDELIVFPAIHPVRPGRVAGSRLREGSAAAAPRGGAQGEFAGLHEYRPGEDLRHVHWRATARHGRLLVREYDGQRERTVLLRVDNAVGAQEGNPGLERLERAISEAASRAVERLRSGCDVGLEARGVAVEPGAGPAQRRRLLTALALLEPVSPEVPFGRACGRGAAGGGR